MESKERPPWTIWVLVGLQIVGAVVLLSGLQETGLVLALATLLVAVGLWKGRKWAYSALLTSLLLVVLGMFPLALFVFELPGALLLGSFLGASVNFTLLLHPNTRRFVHFESAANGHRRSWGALVRSFFQAFVLIGLFVAAPIAWALGVATEVLWPTIAALVVLAIVFFLRSPHHGSS